MMKTNITKYKHILLVVFILAAQPFFGFSFAQDVGGVLVAAEASEVKRTSVLEIRRIYLGLPSSPENMINNPILNISDEKTYKAFLKNVMHMTEKGYQRKLIKRIFRQGGKKILEKQNVTDLVTYLNDHLHDVSFMDEDTAKKTNGIKVVQVLW